MNKTEHTNGGVVVDDDQDEEKNRRPKDIGILAIEVYFPTQYVCQTELEKFDGVSTGKYTIGLGQCKMGFCLDTEDINSICMTVVSNLMEKYGVRADQIGFLEVGTETLVDKSKSVKSCLMQLFDNDTVNNTDIDGLESHNACYGGTAALFNAIRWIESADYDGRHALVVMGDLALYAKGAARPTGGAGAIALLVGPHAPLVFERQLRAVHMTHAYDFYKPVMDSEYPIVDGQLSVVCYLHALDICYQRYKAKYRRLKFQQQRRIKNANHHGINNNGEVADGVTNATSKKLKTNGESVENKNEADDDDDDDDENESDQFTLSCADAFLFHSPYCKLVQKSLARLFWNDYLDCCNNNNNTAATTTTDHDQLFDKFKNLSKKDSFVNKDLEKELMRASEPLFKKKTAPALLFAKEVGNMYTPSLYACLASYLLSKEKEALLNKRVVMFSYGSGSASAMFSLRVSGESARQAQLDSIVATLRRHRDNLENGRVQVEPCAYDAYLAERELTNKRVPRQARFSAVDTLRPGTWYLKSIDELYRRVYERVPSTAQFDLAKANVCLKQDLMFVDEK